MSLPLLLTGDMIEKIFYHYYLGLATRLSVTSSMEIQVHVQDVLDGLLQNTSLSRFQSLPTTNIVLTFSGDGNPFTTGSFGPGKAWQNEIREATQQTAPANDLLVESALRNLLFTNVNGFPDDLVSRNLQRGREHGIPSYNDLRTVCGMDPLAETPPLRPAEISNSTWSSLLNTYTSPLNIDAFTGGLAETAPTDGLVGPLFACIIKRQFLNLRDGDRFFFTHEENCDTQARGLSPIARENVLQRSLAAIMCDNMDPSTISSQERVFEQPSLENPRKACSQFAKLDFKALAAEMSISCKLCIK